MSAGKRNDVWDIVKGLGILFVVAGHGFGGGISRFVNLFHIPLFFFVSGLVFRFRDRSLKALGEFLLKCVKTLWLPSVLYGLFYVLFHNVFVRLHLYDVSTYTLPQFGVAALKHLAFFKTEPLESAMWFLTALFIGRCLLYGVLWVSSLLKEERSRLIVETALVAAVFAFGCFCFYRGIGLPGNADNACSLLPFLYAGYRMKRVQFKRPYVALPALAVLLALLLGVGRTLRMSRNEIVNPGFLLLGSAAGICLTFELAGLMQRSKPCLRAFAYLGRNTIPILCLHLLAFRLVSFLWVRCGGLPIADLAKHPIIAASYPWGLLYTTVGLLAPLLVPVVKSRMKGMGKK